jgi:DNA repair ATPase RecN
MQFRGGQLYELNELLFIIHHLKDKNVEEVASAIGRSKGGLRAKFNTSRRLEDGRTSLRGMSQYDSLAEIYNAFGEELPLDPIAANEDVQRRIGEFDEYIRKYKPPVSKGSFRVFEEE